MMFLKTLLLAAAVLAAFQDPAPDEKAERLKMLFQWLSDPEPEIRETARRELVKLGREVVPQLEDLLKAKGALDIYKIVREIELGKAGPLSEIPGPPLSHEEFLKRIGKPDGTAADAYVRGRMADIFKLFKEKDYQKTYDLVNALLVLEPKSRYAKELHHWRRVCDNMVTQTSIVRSQIFAPHAATAGSKVEFLFRMTNVWRGGVDITFDKELARPIIVVEITVERMDPNGSTTKATRTHEFEIEREIPIAMGAQWEKAITLDTSLEFSDDQDYIRMYTVGAWMPVVKINRAPGAEVQKRIYFEPTTVRLVPEKHMHLAEDPLGKLGKVMDAGSVNEVFICAMLLKEEHKTTGVELLVASLEKAHSEAKKAREQNSGKDETKLQTGMAIISNILTALTGEKRGVDPVKWRKYADGLREPK